MAKLNHNKAYSSLEIRELYTSLLRFNPLTFFMLLKIITPIYFEANRRHVMRL